jgi:type I restriction enzyme R subunit
MALITEDHLEQQCLEWFKELRYAYAFAPNLAPDGTSPERTDFRRVILTGRLRLALQRLNPGVPASTIDSALLQLANPNVHAPSNRLERVQGTQSSDGTVAQLLGSHPGTTRWQEAILRHRAGNDESICLMRNP